MAIITQVPYGYSSTPPPFCLIGTDQPTRVLHLRLFKKRNTLAIFRPVFRLHPYKSVLSLKTHGPQTLISSYLQLVSAVYIKYFPTKSPSLVFYLPIISKCLRYLAPSCAWEFGVHRERTGSRSSKYNTGDRTVLREYCNKYYLPGPDV